MACAFSGPLRRRLTISGGPGTGLGPRMWKTSRRTGNAGNAKIKQGKRIELSHYGCPPEGTQHKEARAVEPGRPHEHKQSSVATAVAEKVSALQGPKFFADRRAHTDFIIRPSMRAWGDGTEARPGKAMKCRGTSGRNL